jgi:hypothetical protein
MNLYIAQVLVAILTLATIGLIAQGQSRDWRVYSSTDDQFTVEVPSGLRITKTGESKNEATLGPDQKDGLDSYISIYQDAAASNQDSNFRILVVNGQAKTWKSWSRNDLLTYLSIMLIGDDDDPQPTSETLIKIDRLVGKEYVWAKESKVLGNGRTNEIFSRGRIFDEGDKIYIIVFRGQNADELKSPTTERFLSSLRLHKRKA